MALLLWLLMALVPFALGKGALRILYGNQPTQEMSPADSVLTGGMICIGLAEATHLVACVLGRSFSDCVRLFGVGLVLCLMVAMVSMFLHRKRQRTSPVREKSMLYLVFGILVVLQLAFMMSRGAFYVDGDMTQETVNSFLSTDAIYQVNPLTGRAYETGMPMRLKILCLPTLYAILCQSFGLSAETVVLTVMPVFVLLCSYLAYSTVAKCLFPARASQRAVFMIVVALMFWVSDYMPGMDGFAVLHSGFRGVSIRAAVLLPYTFGLMLRRKYKLVFFCILAETCMVWTFYGVGACVAVAVGMLCVRIGLDWWAKRNAGKEAG